MNITIKNSILKSAITALKPVVAARPTIPVLQCALIRYNAEGVTITGTDADIWLTLRIDAAPHDEAAMLVSLHDLAKALQGFTNKAMMSLSANDTGNLVLAGDGMTCALNTMPCDDFPMPRHAPDDAVSFTMPAPDLAALIGKTRHAISNEGTRYYLNGIFLHHHEGLLRAVTCDGHRLALHDTPAGGQNMPSVIIPARAVEALHRALRKQTGEANVTMHPKYTRFEVDGATLITKPIDGYFPDYAQVIPSPKLSCLIPVREVVRAAKGAQCVNLVLRDNVLRVEGCMGGGGNTVSLEAAVKWGHEPGKIKFNAKYLCDTLAQIDGGEALIGFDDCSSPALFTDPANAMQRFVIMPMRQ